MNVARSCALRYLSAEKESAFERFLRTRSMLEKLCIELNRVGGYTPRDAAPSAHTPPSQHGKPPTGGKKAAADMANISHL